MKDGFYIAPIPRARENQNARAFLNARAAAEALAFHRSFPAYAPTPLARLSALSDKLGLSGVYVKDESFRFGLNAFKVLGASYAVGRFIADSLGIPKDELRFDKLTSPGVLESLGEVTFVTATDGNHGRGVAWTARMLHQKAVVYMPEGTAVERLFNIRALGAKADILPMSYDACVRYANEQAKKEGWILVQDTAWEGYVQIPSLIMQGYLTMALETVRQLGDIIPTHVFLQAGVGSMPGAVAGFLHNYYGEKSPLVAVVEPNRADCVFLTARANDGELHHVTGKMDTMMAGLACGTPSPLAWDVLRETADYAVSCPDWVSAMGMRLLGNGFGHDPQIISGESGAVTCGLVSAVMERPDLAHVKDALKLDSHSVVLCFSTEGDTDTENYRAVVQHGKCSSGAEDTGLYDES